jgi:hypothetical protein
MAMYNLIPLQRMRYHPMKWAPDVLYSMFTQFYTHQISLKMTHKSRKLLLNRLTSFFIDNKRCAEHTKVPFTYYELRITKRDATQNIKTFSLGVGFPERRPFAI